MKEKVNIFWFRRDLRMDDNVGFYNALRGKFPVLPIFIFDSEILQELPKDDARVTFIYETLHKLNNKLRQYGGGVALFNGTPKDVFQTIISRFHVQNVIANHDYEPYSMERDSSIKNLLHENGIGFFTFKDQVIYEKDDIVKDDGTPYIVYTPYMKKWKERFKKDDKNKKTFTDNSATNLYQNTRLPNLSLRDIGFTKSKIEIPEYDISSLTLQQYENQRNFPAKDATSHLGPHLRFGTVSIRNIIEEAALEKNEVFLQELIWREFFMQILWHFPETVNRAFKQKYDRIEWRNNETEFQKWKEGKTGYPIVDAGMRQLNETGYMHNRVRMVVAGFLCKHLLIDWRWGEAYFAEKLLDYEMSSNIGNWQWAAGSGVDAAPYFRIFNPNTQLEKFDKNHEYVKKYIPEFGTENYPEKIVDHKEARERCLKVYKSAIA
ncbi:deoxyribodipyrimidine photo-lyase [Aequorivita sp. SDUM287046]|uniref:Deoxyribodipyrimidine photo-lyase n=1 Tax=Aequorivita aurantiaca TaxID=3053356 RepID=A0ABT8DG17_9FLAO|nr:deoxyribodipyrimidine photo-lyase [Aequorivita aurantiaca]MDN3723777.1 deoxyribodipyrimidine photo-lyase [Aequorivita aurantiaca]